MKTRVIVAGLIVSLFLISMISASCYITPRANCIGNGNIIFGLSNSTDAHGELASQGDYNYVFCCNEGSSTSCDGSNKIIGLELATNSHAEIPSLSAYTNNICFEDFSCTSRNTSCNSGEVGIISLSANTDAHIGSFNDYETKICCTSNFLDADGDGILNINDPDYNGDGIMDYPYDLIDPNGDIDGDGILNINDEDMDGEGILNGHDPDFDGDNTMDQFTIVTPNGDIDGDGLLNINDGDIDGDGILNGYDSDVDGDGNVEAVCGNDIKEVGEECDDGNNRNDDGCSRVCVDEGNDDDDTRRSSGSGSNRCNPNWDCDSWSICDGGFKTRTCVDLKHCGTNSNKPDEAISCKTTILSSIGNSIISLSGNSDNSKVWGISSTLFWILLIAVVLVLILIGMLLLR